MSPERPDNEARRKRSLWTLLLLLLVLLGTLGIQAARFADDAGAGKVVAPSATTSVTTTSTEPTAPAPSGKPRQDSGNPASTGASGASGGSGSSGSSGSPYPGPTVAPAAPAPAGTPSAPLIVAAPASSPTSSTSVDFTIVSTWPFPVTYECSSDGAKFTVCSSPVTYGGLADGSHTFEARSVAGNKTSGANTYRWTVDSRPPTVLRVSSTVANGHYRTTAVIPVKVTFGEPVTVTGTPKLILATGTPAATHVSYAGGTGTGTLTFTYSVSAGNTSAHLNYPATSSLTGSIEDAAGNAATLTLPAPAAAGSLGSNKNIVIDTTPPHAPVITAKPAELSRSTSASLSFTGEAGATLLCNLDGASSFTTCSRPRSYTGLAQGAHTFAVKARDAAGNVGGAASWGWTVDTIAPATPVLTSTPPNPSSTATSTFDWSESSSDVVAYECSQESGRFTACGPPPITFAVDTSSNGQHQFSVRAIDAAGNVSDAASYSWKVVKGSGQDYTISATVPQPLRPGAAAQVIPIGFDSPNEGNGGSGVDGTRVTNLTIGIPSVSGGGPGPHPCTPADFQITQIDAAAYPFYVPFGTSSLASLIAAAYLPKIQMLNTPFNQDACKGATVHLSFSGTP